jgi:hypothetical protein
VDDLAVKVFNMANNLSVLSFSVSSFKSIRKTAESQNSINISQGNEAVT